MGNSSESNFWNSAEYQNVNDLLYVDCIYIPYLK
jgi:hypothetical protein